MSKKKRMVVVTTDNTKRGVFFGELVKHDEKIEVVELKDAQMVIYWSQATRGVMGLASIGPQEGSRITPIIPKIVVNGVTSIMNATEKAVKEWKKQLWD